MAQPARRSRATPGRPRGAGTLSVRGAARKPGPRAPSAKVSAKPHPRQVRIPRIAQLDADAVRRLFAKLSRAIPNPKSELHYGTPFELLVSVMLSAQALDRSVNLATQRLFPAANTPQAILALGEAGLLSYIHTIGLAPTKARNILATCRMLLERHGGQVPADRESLEALPGVGRKTANIILNTAFGQAVVAVDTHVFRVANRTGLAPGKDVRAVEDGLMRAIPPAYLKSAHHLLILHGRYTCKARQPLCGTCPIRAECAWPEKT